MNKTEWFPDSSIPIHEGLYETRVGDGSAWSLREGALTWSVWRDGFWHYASTERDESVQMAARDSKSFWQKREWRGLKEQMNLQTIKPRAQWKESGYGRYCVIIFSDMPGEYHGRSVDEALRYAHRMRLLCMTSLKAAMGVRAA